MARLDRKPAERVAAAGLIVQIVVGIVMMMLARESASNAATVKVLTWQVLIGVLPWIACLVYLRQSRLADDETLEWQRLEAERAQGGARGQLFEADEIQAFAARNRLRILEKYILPSFSILFVLLLALAATLLASGDAISLAQVNPPRALITIFVLSGITFALFLVGMYAAGMSRQGAWRSLRAPAAYMLSNALFSAVSFAAVGAGYFKYPRVDRVAAWAMLVVLGILAFEVCVNFVLDFYRPRVKGVDVRPAHDSRLLGLLTQPGGIFKTVAATLDYQFGFRVSQTWFYRFIEQAIMPLILFQILTLYLLSCIVIVAPNQRGVIERFGKFREDKGVLEPGLTWKWPVPFERAYRFDANSIQTLTLGHAGEMDPNEKILWTRQHYETEYNVMVASKESSEGEEKAPAVNLIVAAATIRYQITDPVKWYYNCEEPEVLLEVLCNRELMKYFAGVDFFDVMGSGRAKAIMMLKDAMQVAVNEIEGARSTGMGVTILGIGLEGIHPPVAEGVPDAFHGKVVAEVKEKVDILDAEREEIETGVKAETEALAHQYAAQAGYSETVFEIKSRADVINTQNTAFKDGLGMLYARKYLESLRGALDGQRLLVTNVKGLERQHIRLDLQDKPELGVEDLKDFRFVEDEMKEREQSE